MPRFFPGISHPHDMLVNAGEIQSFWFSLFIELVFELHCLVLLLLVAAAHLLLLDQVDMSDWHLL